MSYAPLPATHAPIVPVSPQPGAINLFHVVKAALVAGCAS